MFLSGSSEGDLDTFIHLVDGGVAGAELDDLRADLGDEAAVRRAAGGRQLGGHAGLGQDGRGQRFAERTTRGQERARRPVPSPARIPGHGGPAPHARAFSPSGVLAVAKRKLNSTTASPGTTLVAPVPVQVRHLERGGREVLIALVPLDGHDLGQRRRQLVHRVARQVRVGHVALHALDRQRAGQRAAAAVLADVAQRIARGGFADDAEVHLFATRLERVADDGGAVDRGAFLVGRDQQRDRAAVLRMGRHEFLGRHHEGGDRALHVGRAVRKTVALGRRERVALPFLARARRHVRVAGEHRQRGGASAPRPGLVTPPWAMVSQRKPMRSRRAASVAWQSRRRGDRRAGDQVLDQVRTADDPEDVLIKPSAGR